MKRALKLLAVELFVGLLAYLSYWIGGGEFVRSPILGLVTCGGLLFGFCVAVMVSTYPGWD